MEYEDIFEAEDLFDTTDEPEVEETEPSAEDKTVEKEPTPAVPEDKPAEGTDDTVEVKYNREAKAIDRSAAMKISEALGMSVDELVTNIQKGMNYDKATERRARDDQDNSIIAAVKEMAARTGKTNEEIVKAIEASIESIQLQSAMKKVRGENPYIDDRLAEKMARMQMEIDRKDQNRRITNQTDQERERAVKPWRDLFERFSDLKPDNIPAEVMDAYEKGVSPIEAYLQYQVDQKDVELARARKQAEVKGKNTGSMKSQGVETKDTFEEGFDSVW